MSKRAASRRVFILGNPDKPGVHEALKDVRSFAEAHCEVAGAALGFEGGSAIDAGADLLVVLGGDGTLLAVSRSLGENQIPLVGVNFGKLGYLAEFTVDELKTHFDAILKNGDLISERMILQLRVMRGDKCRFDSLAVNDCVVHAGPPFRLIQMSVNLNGVHLTSFGSDGLIVCTPVGSTAHNLSAGGPILQGAVMGIALTPLCAHSLTLRPLVVEDQAEIEIVIRKANPGTTVLVDGQVSAALSEEDRVVIRRSESTFKLVRNPAYPKWHSLVTKLRWGQALTNE